MNIIEFLFIIISLLIVFYFYFLIFFPLIYAFLGKNIYDYFQNNFEKFKKYVENSRKNDFKNYFLFWIFLIFHIPLSFMDYLVREYEYFLKRVLNYDNFLARNWIKRRKNDIFSRIYMKKESNRFFISSISIIYSLPLVILNKFAERDFHFFRNHLKLLYEKIFPDVEKRIIIKFLKFLNVDNSKIFAYKEDLEKIQKEYEIELEKLWIIRSKQNNDDIQKRYEKLKEIKNLKIEKYKNNKNISEKDLNKNLREKTENKITEKIDFSLEKKLDSESIKNFEVKNIFDDYEDVMKSFEK